ncbi:DUF2330 domain-containing protein, partial [Planktothrix sp. FACHB-1375]|nr:DUF2330 domain-containing protein [Aerosakkonema funiforme FACHB-1375]
QETSNRQNFQGRYILRHAFEGETNCPAGQQYKRALATRFEQEAQTLAKLTGWNINDIRKKLPVTQTQQTPFWRNIWP